MFKRTTEKRNRAKRMADGASLEERLDLAARIGKRLLAAALVLVFAAGFWVERGGPRGWNSLYRRFGLETMPAAPIGSVSVSFLDVGQGDAVLIRQGSSCCLIDAGTPESAESLCRQLRRAGVHRISLLVMTHPHADHIGGMRSVLQECKVEQVLLPDLDSIDYSSATLDRVLKEIEAQKIPTVTAAPGMEFAIGEGTLTVLLAGIPAEEAGTDDAVNDASLCVRFACKDFAFLDTGDAEQQEELALVESSMPLSATVFKAGHHGSYTANSEELLAEVRPQIAVASCGLNNEYGHPNQAAVANLEAVGAEVYRTDLEGAVTVSVMEGTLTVECAKTDGKD